MPAAEWEHQAHQVQDIKQHYIQSQLSFNVLKSFQIKMQFSQLLLPLGMLAMANACFLTVHSSTVGSFSAQHSEPSDHGGAPQTISASHGGCSFTGSLANGCGVTVKSSTGCGSLSFTRVGTGKRAEEFEA